MIHATQKEFVLMHKCAAYTNSQYLVSTAFYRARKRVHRALINFNWLTLIIFLWTISVRLSTETDNIDIQM